MGTGTAADASSFDTVRHAGDKEKPGDFLLTVKEMMKRLSKWNNPSNPNTRDTPANP